MVILVNGLRGPMFALRRFAVIPDLSLPEFDLTSDFDTATKLQAQVARDWCNRWGYFPHIFRNWTTGYGPPQPTEP